MNSRGPGTEDQVNDQMKRYPQILTSRWCLFFRRRQQRADSPGPSCVSLKSDWSMDHPDNFKDGRPSREER
jgi:hypothetical protein